MEQQVAANGLQLRALTPPSFSPGACRVMKQESVEYYRQRARAECEAALNATCGVARKAHAEMAQAYERLVQLGEMEASGERLTLEDRLVGQVGAGEGPEEQEGRLDETGVADDQQR